MKDNKGHQAEKPSEIPKSGWKDILKRVKDELSEDNIGIVAAGVAFYFFLAVFPALVAIISIYGLAFDPSQVEQQLAEVSHILPEEAHGIIEDRLKNITQQSSGALGWGVVLSILVSLWSANNGTKSLFQGINIAYNERSKRGFVKENALTLMFTLGGMILGIICVALVVAFPALVGNMGLPDVVQTIINWARWPLLGIVLIFTLSLIYKYAPDRDNPQFKWVSWGSIVATVLWIAGSLLFSWYVNNFGNYDEMYGSVAAVIILLLWFNLTSYVILLGAEINSELEHQTEKDTTIGEPQPLGERNAYHADHVAPDDNEDERNDRSSKDRDRDRSRRDRNTASRRDRERKH